MTSAHSYIYFIFTFDPEPQTISMMSSQEFDVSIFPAVGHLYGHTSGTYYDYILLLYTAVMYHRPGSLYSDVFSALFHEFEPGSA